MLQKTAEEITQQTKNEVLYILYNYERYKPKPEADTL